MLFAIVACGIQAWSYRITDNYTIEAKFKINAIGAGIIFANYNGFNGNFYMWQFNVGVDGSKSLFRPHHWNPGALLEEKGTGDVVLNTTDWFVTTIEVTNGNHAETYLRRADDDVDVLIDSRDGDFRFGMIGFRQDHDGSVNESASYDYVKITDQSDKVLYFEDFDAPVSWQNDPIIADGALTAEGRELSERRYRPTNMFQDAVDMHYTVEADVTIENGYVSLIFGLTDSGSNYMWQISPNYRNDTGVCNYYHLDNGNESWKAHAAGPNYPDFEAIDFWGEKRHVMIEVKGNVVYTYIDGQLEDTFVQCDMTDLELLNSGKVGIRVDADNQVNHEIYIDNLKLTEYDGEGNATVRMEEKFDGGVARYFELTGKNATYAQVVDYDGDYALYINCDGTTDRSAKVRLIQTDEAVCPHNYQNGICQICGEYEEPGYDTELSAYTIGNLGQLIRFSQIVNGGEQGANGSLTADIDMEYSELFQPIGLNNDGTWQKPFMGTFYGNNHVISNLYVKTECEGGLFSRTRGGKIYNLGLVNGHIESTANLRCGAIAGEHHDNAIMQNCYARGTFEFVTSHEQKNAVAGETAGGHFINCYTTLPLMSLSYPMNGDKTNCYEGVTAEQGASGEITFMLGDAFHQSIGEDAYPELDASKPDVYQLTVGDAGYATFVPTVNVKALPEGVAAYASKTMTDYILLTAVTQIPADNAVIVKADAGNYYYNNTDQTRALGQQNDLTYSDTDVTTDGSQYVLAELDGEVGFYKAVNTIPARKGFIVNGSGVKGFILTTEDDATGIDNIQWSMVNGQPIFNLAGQQVGNGKSSNGKLPRGINIIGNKKVLK